MNALKFFGIVILFVVLAAIALIHAARTNNNIFDDPLDEAMKD